MSRQIILDTETTGLKVEEGHRLIEIGCLEMINRQLTGRSFHYYLNPQRAVDPGAYAVHGLSTEFLADKPSFAEVAQAFVEFVQAAELIIHNASFDLGFLNAELAQLNRGYAEITALCTVTDTLKLARHKHPGQPNNLDALCRRYQVNNTNRELHGALVDAELLAQVYLRMTGGQVELFATQEEGMALLPRQQLPVRQLQTADKLLPIILPTAAELQAHQEFLAMIKTEAGHCLWLDQELN